MPVRLSSLGAALHVKQSASATSSTIPFTFITTTKNNDNSPNNASSYSHGCDKRRLFHASLPLRDFESRNHYEALNVQTNASPQDIKKSFYSLSKAHHPDHNRSDPQASRRFMRISEAYNVLSSPDQRAKYDRDVLRLHDQRASSSGLHQHHRGSYSSTSSTGPAGARPASGLSRRRGTFRGPPPSFYRSGGWGAYSDKRSKAHEESTGGGGPRTASDHVNRERDFYSAAWEAGTRGEGAGGMGYGQQPFGRVTSNTGDIPHFNSEAKAAHTRTQATVDAIRARKMARAAGATTGGPAGDFSEVGTFFAIVGVLGLAISVPYLIWIVWTEPQKPSRDKRELVAGAR